MRTNANQYKLEHPDMPSIPDRADVLVMETEVLGCTDWSVCICQAGRVPVFKDLSRAQARQLIAERGLVRTDRVDRRDLTGTIWDTPDMRGRQCYPLGIVLMGGGSIALVKPAPPKSVKVPVIPDGHEDPADDPVKVRPEGPQKRGRKRGRKPRTHFPPEERMAMLDKIGAFDKRVYDGFGIDGKAVLTMSDGDFAIMYKKEWIRYKARKHYHKAKAEGRATSSTSTEYQRAMYQLHREKINAARRERYREQHPKF